MARLSAHLLASSAVALGLSLAAAPAAWSQGSTNSGTGMHPPVTTGSSGISESTSQGPPTLPARRDPGAPVTTGSSGISETTTGGTAGTSGAMGSATSGGSTMSTSTGTSASGMSAGGGSMSVMSERERVLRAQQVLIGDGARIEADGIMGPRTEAALREWQGRNGLSRTGRLDDETMRAMGMG